MKAVRLAAIFSFLFVLAAKLACAQNDYVITKNHDTIRCDIKRNMISGNFKYCPRGDDKYTIIDSTNVTEFYTAADSSTYLLMKVPGSHTAGSRFLNWIEKGKINLYELQVFTGANGAATTFWYAAKDGGDLMLIKVSGIATGDLGSRGDRKSTFMKMIADFPTLFESFSDQSYTFTNIENCVINYNNLFFTYSKVRQ